MPELRSFDAFPKVERAYQKTSGVGSPTQWLMIMLGLFLLWIETTTFIGAHADYEYSVDTKIRDTFDVNLALKVGTQCKHLDIFLQDATEDRLFVSELVQKIPFIDELGKEWCVFGGQFKANRVQGSIVVTHKGAGFFSPPGEMDYSHEFMELSFGQYHPGIINPLDGRRKTAKGDGDYFTYMLTLLPTRVKALGTTLETTQYSVAEFTTDPTHVRRHPGIFIEYDFDAVNVDIVDARMPFLQWLARVANIVGGIVVLGRGFLKLRSKKAVYRDQDLLTKDLKE